MSAAVRLSIVLHAHTPLTLGDADGADASDLHELCELGLIPLIELASGEERGGGSAGAGPVFTLALSPSLLAMLADPSLGPALDAHLVRRVTQVESEVKRLGAAERPGFEALARAQLELARGRLASFRSTAGGDLLDALEELHVRDKLMLVPSAGSHAVLPLVPPPARRLHLAAACGDFREHFGVKPRGFWLPEGAWAEGVDDELSARGVAWTIAAANGVRPVVGAPDMEALPALRTPRGLTVLPEAAFLRQALVGPDGARRDRTFLRPSTGSVPVPLHSVGEGGPEPWSPGSAAARAETLASALVASILRAVGRDALPGRRSTVVLALELAEVGPRWPDGPAVLSCLARAAAKAGLQVGPPDPQADDAGPEGTPISATWRSDGYFATWVDDDVGWLYRRLERLTARLLSLRTQAARAPEVWRRALAQALRELMCAQSSDWPAAIVAAGDVDRAVERFEAHASAAERLAAMLDTHSVDADAVAAMEARWSLFDDLDALVS